MSNKLFLILAALSVAASSSVFAADAMMSTGDATLKTIKSNVTTSCQAELDKFCKGVTPGGGRIASCLESRNDQLSPGCANAWQSAKEDISHRIDKAQVAFRKDCGSDVQKYCSDVPSGEGKVLSCLNSHSDSLSNSCQQFQAKLEQRLSEFLG